MAKKKITISLIAAMGKNRIIGVDGGLPWDLPDDRMFFRHKTLGKILIKGRKTYEAIGRLLPDREHIILTRDKSYDVPGAHVVHTKHQAMKAAEKLYQQHGNNEIMIIGGQQIYELFLPEADRIYLTIVDAEPTGDAYFPEFDESKWEIVERKKHPADDFHAHAFEIRTYERKKRR